MFLRNFTLKVAHAQPLTWKEKRSVESTTAALHINPEYYRFEPVLRKAQTCNIPGCLLPNLLSHLETANSS